MRSRLLKYLGGSTVATAVYTWMNELAIQNELRHNYTEITSATQNDSDSSNTLITKAFRDIGWKNPIYISETEHSFGRSITAFDNNGHRVAIINYPLGIPVGIQYAIMAHEAVHCLHEHAFVKAAAQAYAWCFSAISAYHSLEAATVRKNWLSARFAISSMFFASAIPLTIIGRLCEIDADLTSARKAGTARLLIRDLQERSKIQKQVLDEERNKLTWRNPGLFYDYARLRLKLLFDEHPPIESRIRYLHEVENRGDYKQPESREFRDICIKPKI